MRKALAQNPNLLRTLIGLGLTLIFLLGYAVYGATVNTEYYIYNSNSEETNHDLNLSSQYYDDQSDTTTWTWNVVADGSNLSWINLSVTNVEDGTLMYISNSIGYFSHPSLGDEDATGFSCSESCNFLKEHRTNSTDNVASIYGLTNPDPSIRGKGTVYADSIEQGKEKAMEIINNTFEDPSFSITVIEKGDRDVEPNIKFVTINEEFSSIERFEVDAATEFMWALAAVIGCFSMVLVPSFTIYFAARAKEKKLELKLEEAKSNLESE